MLLTFINSGREIDQTVLREQVIYFTQLHFVEVEQLNLGLENSISQGIAGAKALAY